jgi:serine/threonine protein kinase
VTAVPCPFCGSEHTAGTYVCPVTNRRLQGLLPVNTIVDGKYRIDGIIGVGGMGVVYRAEHTKIARQVALKMLLPEYIVYPDLVARVEREARTAGQIEHPNVVSIVDLGSTDDQGPYIAMELLRGQELATTVEKAGGRLDAAEAVDIMRQVLAGLEAAHKRGVIHRDLKPENIFLMQQEDGVRVVKVLDFGISKLRDESQLSSLTRTGTVMGTPQFMAPEQAAGARDQDVRIDLYAAGAVLYAVLCNGLPYEAENYNLLINEILNKAPIPILSRNATLDTRLASIVMKSIAKKPEQRFQTARSMSEALTHWHDNRNAPAPPSRVATAPMPAVRSRKSSDGVVPVSPRRDGRFGPGARELGRGDGSQAMAYAPHALTDFDEDLSPDDPNFVDRNEATIVVPTVLPEGVSLDDVPEVDAEVDDDAPLQPRSSRPSSPRAAGSERPSVSALIESPLDAPPLVIPQKPKPPPSDAAWEKLRTDHPSSPPADLLLDESTHASRPRVWPYVLLFLLVSAAGAAIAIHRYAPHLWEQLSQRVGLSHAPVATIDPPLVRPADPPPAASAALNASPVDASVAGVVDAPSAPASDVVTDAPTADAGARDGEASAPTPRRRHRSR